MKKQNNHIQKTSFLFTILIMSVFIIGCDNKVETNIENEFDESEIIINIPELNAMHEQIFLLWHDAYPNKDYELIKEILPDLDVSVSNLLQVELPEILHGKRDEWKTETDNINSTLKVLHNAVEQNEEELILSSVEAFHSSYEKLIGIIRPKLPELESFHQEMYKLYHYYMPNENVEEIQGLIPIMNEKIELLKQAQMPYRYQDKQTQFNQAVNDLEVALSILENSANSNDIETLKVDVENLHTAYQMVEHVFE